MPATNFKVTFFFGFKKWGWTETLYWTSDTADIEACEDDARTLALARRRFLGQMASLEAVRIDGCDATGQTFFIGVCEIKFGSSGAGNGGLTGACLNPWLAYATRFYTRDRLYAANFFFRGIPADYLCFNSSHRVPFPTPDKLLTPMKTWAALVTKNKDPFGGGVALVGSKYQGLDTPVGTWSIRANEKADFLEPTVGRGGARQVKEVALDPSGYFTIVMDYPVVFSLATKVHLHGFKGDGLQNLNGDAVVTSNATNPMVLNKQQMPSGCTIKYDGRGVVWKLKTAIFPPTNGTLSRPIRRATGLTHFGTKGGDTSKRAQKGK